MLISLSWLKQYISTSLSKEEIANILTQTGLEVEKISSYSSIEGNFEGLIVGKVLDCNKHPNADRLKITSVDIGQELPLTIVCGAENVAEKQTVIVATVGATLYPKKGQPFKIKKSKIRGEISQGMICAEDEIGIGNNHEWIIVLPDENKAGTAVNEVLNVHTDTIFEIGITPNRTDALSHFGVARDLGAVLKQKIHLPKAPSLDYNLNENTEAVKVNVLNNNACPRFVGATITNVKVEDSPEWLQNYLSAIGLRPINNIVDISNYVMMEWGIPIHVYDREKIDKHTLNVGFLPEGTLFTTLDDKERKLLDEDIVIYSGKNKVECLAGVFGGKDSGVTEKTKNIFVESAYWNPEFIRKTATRHKLKTDATFRYERGTDPNGCKYAVHRFAYLLFNISNKAELVHVFDFYPNPITPKTISLKWSYINSFIGKNIEKDEILDILCFLDFKIISKDDVSIKISTPTYRTDVHRGVDVLEEILRIYGFNNIPLSENLGATYIASFPKKYPNQIQYEKTLQLSASGWFEISTNSLESPKFIEDFSWLDIDKQVKVLNAKSEELSVLRQTMLFSGLTVIAKNISYKQKNLKLFEFGKVYEKKAPQKYVERNVLCFYLTGKKNENHWQNVNVNFNVHDLKQDIYMHIISKLPKDKITEIAKTKDEDREKTMYNKYLKVLLGKDLICTIGEVQSKYCDYFGIEDKVYYAEINWDAFLKGLSTVNKYKLVPKYPEVTRDLSLVIPKNITYKDIKSLLNGNNKYVKNIQLFDKYQGKGLETNQKSYALRFTLQDNQQTLNDNKINKTMKSLMNLFEQELGAIIRQ